MPPNTRIYSTASVEQIKACFDRGMTKPQTAAHLNLSLQALRQACSVITELQDIPNDYGRRSTHDYDFSDPFKLTKR